MSLGNTVSIRAALSRAITYVKDNLKIYFDFKSSRAKTLEFVGTGSAYFDGTGDYVEVEHDMGVDTDYGTVMYWVKRLSSDTVDYYVDFRGTDNDDTTSSTGILYSSSSTTISLSISSKVL